MTLPAVVSAVDGMYVGLSAVRLEKQLLHPLEELQTLAEAFALNPAKVAVSLFLQSDWLGPAFEIGAALINIVIVSVTFAQVTKAEVKVKITLRLVVSVSEAV